MRRGMLASVFVVGILAVALSGCGHISSITIGKSGSSTIHERVGHGPPSHAPAHGQRRKQQRSDDGLRLAFDSDLGVYVVVDIPNYYYWDGYYLRIEGDRWYSSARVKGEWTPRSPASLPPGLRKKPAKAGHAKKHRGRGQGPAKGGW